jgi:hypothetical protein
LFDDRLLDEGGVDRLLAGLQRRQHGGQGEVLDEARDAAGVVEEGRDGVGLERVLASPRRLEVAVEEERDFGFVQRAKAEPDAEALGVGIVLGFAEALFEEGLPDEDEGEGAPAIKVIGGEEPEVFEGGVRQEVRFVDEEDGALWAGRGGGRGGRRRWCP